MISVILFGEDAAHESFLKALLSRLGREYEIPIEIHYRPIAA